MVERSACDSTQKEIASGPVRAHMLPYGGKVGRIYCATSESAGSPLTRQRRGNSTGTLIGVPTEDTGKGTEGPAPGRTRRDRTMGAVQDTVAEEAFTLVGYRTGQTSEAELCEGEMAITPPPNPPPIWTDSSGRRSELSGRR